MAPDRVFEEYGRCYDLLYGDKDYAAEADYVAALLSTVSPGAGEILEFGAGTGRHGRLLADRGYRVTGIERSPVMRVEAESRALAPSASGEGSFVCSPGDIRTADLARQFDAVMALFHVVSYQTANADVSKTFESACRHLRPGGVFLFDVWHGPAVLTQRPSVRVKRMEDATTRLTRIAEPELDMTANVVRVRYTMLVEAKADHRLTTFNEEHRLRYFFPVEIALLACHTGFVIERSEEFLTGKTPSDTTWGVAYLLRKQP